MRAFIFLTLVAACCATLIEKPIEKEIIAEEIKKEVPRFVPSLEIQKIINKAIKSKGKVSRDMEGISEEAIKTREIKIESELQNSNFTKCIYKPEDKLFSCRGPIGEVECTVVANLTVLSSDLYKIFGLGKWEESEILNKSSSIIERRFWLYPRKLDNTTYLNHTVLFEGKLVDLELYYSDKFEQYGLRVTDAKCYERLVELFAESNDIHMAKLEDADSKFEVPLFGEALIVDRIVNKRWGWGYGFGGWGWGWGGLYGGWGYPYYGLWWGK